MLASTRGFPPAGILALAVVLHLLLPSAACSNGGPVYDYDGNQIVPLNSDEVQLVREAVQVDLSPGQPGLTSCRYLLRNLTEQEVDLSIAFVWAREVAGGLGHDFRAWIGKTPAAVRWMHADPVRWRDYAGGADLDSLPVWDIRIPGNDTVAVRCEYPVGYGGGTYQGGVSDTFVYHTKAAALWAGTIDTADIEVNVGEDWRFFFCKDLRLPPYVESKVQPSGYRWNGSTLRWHFENWEPSQDIVLDRYTAFALRWQEFFECRTMSEADCDFPIELPAYAADSVRYEEAPLLEAIRDGFTHQYAAEPIAGNYEAFAHAYLEALRLEISGRHGAPFDDWNVARFFEVQINYAADPSYDRSRLNATERMNEQILAELERRIERQPELLLPLPSRE